MASSSLGAAYISIYPEMAGFEAKIKAALSGIDVSSVGDRLGRQIGDGVDDGMSRASDSAGKFTGKLSALAGVAGGVAAELAGRLFDAVANLGSEMVEAADSSQKFASTLSFAGIDDSTIQQLTASTQEYADQTVYDLADIRNATAQLAANGVADYATLAEAAGNLNAVAGGNAETFKSVSMVMSQTAGSGKLMTENWNQLTDAIPGASGALQQAMKDAGAFEGNFREAMENGEISADEFFAAVQQLGMTDVAVEAATSTSTIEGALGNLQASVVGIGSQAISALTPMITGAMNQVTSFISGIPSALAPVGQAIQAAISGGGTETLAAVITDMVTQGMQHLSMSVQQAAQQLPAVMQAVVPVALTALTSFLTTVWTQFPSLFMSFLGYAVSAVSSFVSSLAGQLPTMLPIIAAAALQQINNLMTEIFENLPTYIGQLVTSAVQLFHGIADAIPQVIPVVVQGIGTLVRNVLNNLPTFLGQMINAAVTLFTGIVSAIPQVVPAVLDGIASLLSEVWDAVSSFDLASAGRDLIQGLINGIGAMGGAVIDAIGGVVGGAIDWAKGLLGIASPSKLFRSFGAYTMEGLALGIDDEASAPVRAVRKAMGSVEDVMAASGSLSVSAASAASASPSASSGPSPMDLMLRIVALLEAIYGAIPEGEDARSRARRTRKEVAYAV